jgi:hypothetical protein
MKLKTLLNPVSRLRLCGDKTYAPPVCLHGVIQLTTSDIITEGYMIVNKHVKINS